MPKTPQPSDLHEWISFEDPTEDRTWVIDATFLLSSWTCIYGRGCQGVLTADATALQQGCCSYGAHFLDKDDVETVRKSSARLTADQWQFRKEAKKLGWLDKDPDSGDDVTRVHEGACIFLNRPGFGRGAGCALHVGALDAGERPMDWKPDVCWQLPIRLEEHTDSHGHVTSTVREWKRRDWGDAGEEFHWWCTNDQSAFVGSKRVFEEMKDEISELVEPHIYPLIVDQLKAFVKRRAKAVALPHPAVRRKKD
ncbi:MAG: hypothetical protein F2934_03200 [Actinobacteria bacterium]|uniref:Unannotated protein n=1 Tax=freshwater metagenome TaxID=449393 RepID=A0A6J6SWN3_9ZZZZ|nr:hypothetical protein [Actinomycetota bacterium]MSX21862.1 hypothetical protein [Actinomycetota bacterium]MSX80064.1 hypothetical protein [Actinomycetota bacterium]MSZ03063.1 hypothetical protein [Actinomycetota bacterium]MTB06121.1 hypothetical protein [Actinomycetota bacterium]